MPKIKRCIVPKCKNRTPGKIFFFVPKGEAIRRKWCVTIGRDMISPLSTVYCCEDHFDIEEDTINYFQHKMMKLQGKDVRLRLKKGVVPHKFYKTSAESDVEGLLNKTHQQIIEDTLANYTGSKQSISNEKIIPHSCSEEGTSTLSSILIYRVGERI